MDIDIVIICIRLRPLKVIKFMTHSVSAINAIVMNYIELHNLINPPEQRFMRGGMAGTGHGVFCYDFIEIAGHKFWISKMRSVPQMIAKYRFKNPYMQILSNKSVPSIDVSAF